MNGFYAVLTSMCCMQTTELKQGIAKFYDESSGLWEDVWGDHMHHGYYPKDGPSKTNQEAQIDMINESLKWAGITSAKKARDNRRTPLLPLQHAVKKGQILSTTRSYPSGSRGVLLMRVNCTVHRWFYWLYIQKTLDIHTEKCRASLSQCLCAESFRSSGLGMQFLKFIPEHHVYVRSTVAVLLPYGIT